MAVTRINNNQITDASAGNVYLGIDASTKLQNYSITSGKIANNLTYGSNLTVTGNLTVQGNTTAIDTTITTIEDPVILLASMQTGAPAVDIGFIGQRGTSENIAFVWQESSGEFIAAFTSTSETDSTVTVTGYADIHSANANIGGDATINGNVTVTGTTSLGGNIIGAVNATDTVTGGNVATAGYVSATGAVTGGNVLTTGGVSATGVVIAGNVETSGTVSATGTVTGGNVETAGFLTVTGNVTGGNITTAGSLTGGNIYTAGEVSATGNITANASSFFIGNGRQLSGITAESANAETLTGTFLANNVVNSSLTTVGILTGLSVSGDTTSGNLYTGGEVSATGTVTGGNVATSGYVSATGDVTGGNIATGGTVSATGTVTGGNLATGGTATVTGTVTGGNVATGGYVSATGDVTGGNVATGGTVSATGDVTGGNLATGGYVSATGDVTGGNLATGGTTSASGTVTGGNIATGGTVSATGNITGANVNTAQVYGASTLTLQAGTGNVNLNTTGNVVLANTYIGGVANPQQDQDVATKFYVDNMASTGLAFHTAVAVSTTTNLATATGGTITYDNGAAGVGATLTTTGAFTTIDTANVQTVGTRILVKNEANAAFNGIYEWTNTTTITRTADADTYGPDSSVDLSVNDYFFTIGGDVNKGTAFIVSAPVGVITFGTSNITFAVFSQSQVYTANTAAGLSLTGTVFSAKVDNNTTAFDGGGNISVKAGANLTTPNIGAATGTSLSTTGTITGGNLETGGTVSATGTITGGNLATGGTATVTGTITGGNVATGGTVSATGDVTGGNVATGGTVSAIGTVTGGNVATGGYVSATGDVTGGNVATGGTVSATGTVTGGNLSTGGTATVTGTITGGNVATAGFVSAAGSVTGGNIYTAGEVSATGNITASASGFFVGNGSQLTGVTATSVDANNLTGTTLASSVVNSSLTSVGSLTVLSVVGTATAGNVATAGYVSATGSITGGNLYTSGSGGDISGSGNITGGNISTGGFVTATGTVTGGNIATAGTASVAGNITGGNIYTAGQLQVSNIVISGDNITDTNGRVNFNTAQGVVDFAVNGTAANVLYVNATTNTASFGTASQTINSIVSFNSTNSIRIPVGNSIQRPAGSTGQVRFNTTTNYLEVYDNNQWTQVGAPSYTLITDQQFNGDDATVVFTLSGNATTAGTIVSINGVQQIPTTAYAVSGSTLTFTEAPAVGDLIDVRVLNTTTSVYSISNGLGTAAISVVDGSPNVVATGNIVASGNVYAQNFVNTSDASLKDNVTPITNAGAVIDGLNGVGYDWKDGSGHAYGLIAQAVEQILPEAVSTNEAGIKSVNYVMVTPFLIETIKELRRDIAEIKAQIQK